MIRVFFGVPESYGNSPGEVNGPYWALMERGKKGQGGARLPPDQTELEKGWVKEICPRGNNRVIIYFLIS